MPPDVTIAPRLTLATLGACTLSAVGEGVATVGRLEPGKPLALVAFLALAPNRAASRERLTDLLWADRERDSARAGLRQALWFLRAKLGAGALTSHGDFVTLAVAVDVDSDSFADAVQRGEFERAVALYRGDFLPEFATPGGGEFERWADVERQRYRSLFAYAAESLARKWLAEGHFRGAQQLARQVRDMDSERQGAWRLLLESLLAARDSAGAMLEAEAFERQISDSGIEAERATQALLRLARQAASMPAASDEQPSSLFVADLVGREREFSALLAAWEAARQGSARHIHISGPPGLGKSRMLADLHGRLRAARARAVLVRASSGARSISYGLAADLASALVRLPGARGVSTSSASVLVALDPSISATFDVAPDTSAGEDALRRRTSAVAELLGAVAEEQPIALLLDDWHWADPASRRLIAALITRLGHERAMVVTAGRPFAENEEWPDGSERITLAPLGVDAVGQMVSSLGGLPIEAWAEELPCRLHAATGGSPLLVLEMLHLAIDQDVLRRDGEQWSAPAPDRLFDLLGERSAIRHRMSALEDADRRLVLPLAVDAMPLQEEVLSTIAGLGAPVTVERLMALERRGIIAKRGEACWTLAHDELGQAALDMAAPSLVIDAHRALGNALLSAAGAEAGDERELRRAAAHLASAKAWRPLHDCVRRFTAVTRRRGDPRPVRDIVSDLLGDATDSKDVGAVVRSLPARVRFGFDRRSRVLAIVYGMGLVAIGAGARNILLARPPRPIPDAVFAVVEQDSAAGGLRANDVPIFGDEWGTQRVIDVDMRQRPTWRLDGMSLPYNSDVTVSAQGWTTAEATTDSGAINLFERSVDGTRRRLTFARHDDVTASWAPDESHLVFASARWDPLSHYDLAVWDTATKTVRQLTSGEDIDLAPTWSPDGSRIAFTRRVWATSVVELCTIDADGSHLQCAVPRGATLAGTLGWFDAQRVLAQVTRDDRNALALINADDWRVDMVDDAIHRAVISPDGRWVLCNCIRRGIATDTWVVYPTERPMDYVPVRVARSGGATVDVWWAPTSQRPPFADRLVIDAGPNSPIVGLQHRLEARGISRTGSVVPLGVVRWRSLDTSVARIDSSTGVLTPRTVGHVRVEASAGGWRWATANLDVRVVAPRVLLDESWTEPLEDRWVPFGTPKPSVKSDSSGVRALWNNGDGWFESGVYSRQVFSARDGLTIEATVRTPITLGQWQLQEIGLTLSAPVRAASASALLSGDVPNRRIPGCGVAYPGSTEGAAFADSIELVAEPLGVRLRPPERPSDGRRFRVRVDVFPDGRCGFVLDGVPLWVSPPVALGDSVVAMLSGRSVRTSVRVEHARVRTGASTEIEWSRVESRTPGRVAPGTSARTP